MLTDFARRWRWAGGTCVALAGVAGGAFAQGGAGISGTVTETASGRPVVNAVVSVEGTTLVTRTDEAGQFRIVAVSPGPHVVAVRYIGFAPARAPITVPATGVAHVNIALARTALQMQQVHVTAEDNGRARGELGTATVIAQEAIRNQSAASLAGVLELVPGIPLQPPGVDATQQVTFRSVPTISGIAERTAAFGTLIVLDGVPVSNNANLQTTGPRGEILPSTSAGGSVDLRRIPAATLERVEVIRGVPSARYGDLTAGAIVIDTRAGAFPAELLARSDPSTSGLTYAAGRALRAAQDVTLSADLTRTTIAPGVRDASVWRGTFDAAHRLEFGGAARQPAAPGAALDSRLSVFQLYQNEPEQPDIHPGQSSSDRSGGLRWSERLRLGGLGRRTLEVTASVENEWQDTRSERLLVRGAEPFTDRLTPGTSVGHFVAGSYPGAVHLVGKPWHLYARVEQSMTASVWGGEETLRLGGELRREWNAGPGYQFDIERPPQVSFNGVNGYDRPYRFDAMAPIATTGAYVDARMVRAISREASVDLQAGLRADVLHRGAWWISGARDAVLEPRVNLQVAPTTWLRLRAAWGITAKVPAVGDLSPPPQYFDLVNVNWYPPDSSERLAVLTTSIFNPNNPNLGYAEARKSELGMEMDLGAGSALGVTVFRDVTTGALEYVGRPSFLVRDRYTLSDTAPGSGRPPSYSPASGSGDTVPIFVDRPDNSARVENTGLEWTLSLPEIRPVHTHIDITGAWTISRTSNAVPAFVTGPLLADFVLDTLQRRTPYWVGTAERGERSLATARIVHHQPALGLVITGTVQYFIRENSVQEAATDTLAWAGYVTRAGVLVAVPPQQRTDSQYADLRTPRQGVVTIPTSPAPDWLASLQVTKAILGRGRLSFYAFNVLDRLGQPTANLRAARIFSASRFGLEVTIPVGGGGSQ